MAMLTQYVLNSIAMSLTPSFTHRRLAHAWFPRIQVLSLPVFYGAFFCLRILIASSSVLGYLASECPRTVPLRIVCYVCKELEVWEGDNFAVGLVQECCRGAKLWHFSQLCLDNLHLHLLRWCSLRIWCFSEASMIVEICFRTKGDLVGGRSRDTLGGYRRRYQQSPELWLGMHKKIRNWER